MRLEQIRRTGGTRFPVLLSRELQRTLPLRLLFIAGAGVGNCKLVIASGIRRIELNICFQRFDGIRKPTGGIEGCLLYTSDAADE